MSHFTKTKHFILFITFILILLFLDIGQFFLLGSTVIPLLLCIYASLLLLPLSPIVLFSISLLQCLEFFCFYNSFFLPFIYLVPITFLGLYFKKHLYPSLIHPIALVCIGTGIQIYAIEGSFLPLDLTNHYTIMQMSGIIIVTICFSLTLQSWGMQDNR